MVTPTLPRAWLGLPTAPTENGRPSAGGSGRRRLPLWGHAAALAVLLAVAAPLVGSGASFSTDEGAAVLQARQLERSGHWVAPHQLPGLDPEGAARPFVHGDAGSKGLAPYAKHPLYPLVLLSADRLGGPAAMLALSLLGTVLAAAGAAVLARTIDRRLDRLTLWVVGAGSPLVFDGYLLLAHTLAAAAAVWAVVAVTRMVDGGRGRRQQWTALAPWAALAAALTAVAVALRSEGILLAGALAAGAVAGGVRAGRWRPAAAAAAGVMAAGLLVRGAERWFTAHTLGAFAGLAGAAGGGGGFLAGRAQGLVATWFTAGDGRHPLADALLLSTMAAWAATGMLLRRGRGGPAAVVAASAAAATAAWGVAGPPGAVPGLAVAFPLGWAALWVLRRDAFDGSAATVAGTCAGLTVLGVVLTQYSFGGGVEWGGRFFAIALPIAVPVLAGALARSPGWDGGGARARRTLAAAAVIAAGALSVGGLRTLADVHHRGRVLASALAEGAATAGPPGGTVGGDRALVVSTKRLLPQGDWPQYERMVWLTPEPGALADYVDRLFDQGVRRFVLVTTSNGTEVPVVERRFRPAVGPAAARMADSGVVVFSRP